MSKGKPFQIKKTRWLFQCFKKYGAKEAKQSGESNYFTPFKIRFRKHGLSNHGQHRSCGEPFGKGKHGVANAGKINAAQSAEDAGD